MPTREYPNPEPSGRCQTGATNLQNYMMGKNGLSNLGCYNPNSSMSGGGPSWHVHGEAIDLGCNWYDTGARARGDACFAELTGPLKEELNLQQVIWGDRIYDVSYNAVHGYGGDDHKNHLHVALGHHAAATWTRPSTQPVPPPQLAELEEPSMIVIYKGTPHTFWIAGGSSHVGELFHSWGQGTKEPMDQYAPGERYNAAFDVAAVANGDWLNVRVVCNDHPTAGRRLMCFDYHPGRKPAWSAYTVTP